jgi:hypothetical protein
MSGPDATLVRCSCGGRGRRRNENNTGFEDRAPTDAAAGGLIMCDTCGDYIGIWTPAADQATARFRSFASRP